MGTNYYYKEDIDTCCHCGRTSEEVVIHIGKSSAGWRWLFNGTKYKSYQEWMFFLANHKDSIYDEYNRKIDFTEITYLFDKEGMSHGSRFSFKDKDGYELSNTDFS